MLKLDQSMTTSSLFWSICVLVEDEAMEADPVVTAALNGLARAEDGKSGSARRSPIPMPDAFDRPNEAEDFRAARTLQAAFMVMESPQGVGASSRHPADTGFPAHSFRRPRSLEPAGA
jgi:hypothetical protein